MTWRLWHEPNSDTFVATDDEGILPPEGSNAMHLNEKPSEEQLQVLEKHGHDHVVIEKGQAKKH
jgi:hypothetical protein